MELKKIDKNFYSELGRKLDDIRFKRGYSLRYLSKLTGLSSTTLDNYMLGKTRIKPNVFEEICKALEINADFKVEIKLDC